MTSEHAPSSAVNWRNLINVGRGMLIPSADGATPTDEHIRRAVSSAYYAMFHALAASNADALIGAPTNQATERAWSRVYRGLDHGTARRELQRHRQEFSTSAQTFAEIFQYIQERRHSADYNPSATFSIRQVTELLTSAETTIISFLQTDHSERAYIATLTLIRGR